MLAAALCALSLNAQSVIKLNPQSDGRYTIDATVNGVGVKTYYAAENWFASVSSTTYRRRTPLGVTSSFCSSTLLSRRRRRTHSKSKPSRKSLPRY